MELRPEQCQAVEALLQDRYVNAMSSSGERCFDTDAEKQYDREVCQARFPVSFNVSIDTRAAKISKHVASNPSDLITRLQQPACF